MVTNQPASGCTHHGCHPRGPLTWRTAPNLVTCLRTIAAVVLACTALAADSGALLGAALLCYWIGDIGDGMLARRSGRETRTGAVLDILADRLCIGVLAVVYLADHRAMLLPAVVFLTEFVLLDGYLSLAFRRWSLLSPNYFALVDRRIHLLNWSPPAKAANTGAVVLVVLVTHSAVWATALAAAVLAVKSYSLARLRTLATPDTPDGCSRREAHAEARGPRAEKVRVSGA